MAAIADDTLCRCLDSGHAKGRLTKLERSFVGKPWRKSSALPDVPLSF